MSAYNFNSNNREFSHANGNQRNNVAANRATTNSNNNNTPSNNFQNDADFINRNFSSPNHPDRSVQLTSKTALLVRQRRIMLEPLSCFLCKGYFIDATTIGECMDSFCKSCIVSHLQSNSNCPKCGILIHRTEPLSALRSDKMLQDIVYKMVPGLYDNEMKRRRNFYKNLFGTSSSSEEDDDSTSSPNGLCSGLSSEQYGVIAYPKPFYKPSDSIDLSIEPQTKRDGSRIYYDNQRQSIVTSFTRHSEQRASISGSSFSAVDGQHFKTFLRCPAKMTCVQLKKFIATKFNTCRADTIHLSYLNETLKDEYSLIDVAYIYDCRGLGSLRLFYIIERDLSKNSAPIELIDEEKRAPKIARQSVGTTAQVAIKKVCIDPEPRYYGVHGNNDLAKTCERGRRQRAESSSQSGSASRAVGTPSTQTSIMKQTSSVGEASDVRARCPRDVEFSPQSSELSLIPTASSSHTRDAPNGTRRLRSQDPLNSAPEHEADSKQSVESKNLNGIDAVQEGKGLKADPKSIRDRGAYAVPRRQILPYSGNGFPAAVTTTTQSSLVTLANFIDPKSRHVMSSNSSAGPATTEISNSYRNMITTDSEFGQQIVRQPTQSNNTLKPLPVPQLAFSFVTERGITIVRRINNQNESSNISQGTSSSEQSSSLALAAPEVGPSSSNDSGSDLVDQIECKLSNNSHASAGSSSPSTLQTSRHSSSDETAVARHHIKVKPVYKTFVDPTKLKSPNFKKLGFTARH